MAVEILIIEDDEHMAGVLRRMLKKSGYNVHMNPLGRNVSAVEQFLGENPIDLILVDTVLESHQIDGFGMAEKIHEACDIPVVYITGNADEMQTERAAVTEFHGHIVKPFNGKEVRAAIELALYKWKTERELIQYRDNIEGLVRERTERLLKANEALTAEITGRIAVEESLRQELIINTSIAELSRRLLSSVSIQEMTSEVITHARQLTDSQYCCVGYIERENGTLITPIMSEGMGEVFLIDEKMGIVFKENFRGICGWMFTRREEYDSVRPSGGQGASESQPSPDEENIFPTAPQAARGTLVTQVAVAGKNGEYTAQDSLVVKRLATLFAFAVQRNQTEDVLRGALKRSQQRETEIALLLKSSRAILKYRSFIDSAKVIFDHCIKLVGAPFGFLIAIGESREEVETIVSGGSRKFFHEDDSFFFSMCSLYSEFFGDKKAVIINDFVKSRLGKLLQDRPADIESILLSPLVIGDRVSGLLGLCNKKEGFCDNDVHIGAAFGELSAISLHNSRLIEYLKKSKYEAEAASSAKSTFLANISHELRTPLNSIIGFSRVLLEENFGKLNEKQTVYMKTILDSGSHLLSLINDILDMSKAESGKTEITLVPVDVKSVLETGIMVVQEKAKKHQIWITCNISDTMVNKTITADERMLKQIIFNLLSNATKFTPDGGSISIEAGMEKENLVISVTDTGIGIEPELQHRIFEPFYQVQNEYWKPGSGTGLGLALVKQFAEMHGGTVSVESNGTGKGSRFSVSIPAWQKEEEKSQRRPARSPGREKEDGQ